MASSVYDEEKDRHKSERKICTFAYLQSVMAYRMYARENRMEFQRQESNLNTWLEHNRKLAEQLRRENSRIIEMEHEKALRKQLDHQMEAFSSTVPIAKDAATKNKEFGKILDANRRLVPTRNIRIESEETIVHGLTETKDVAGKLENSLAACGLLPSVSEIDAELRDCTAITDECSGVLKRELKDQIIDENFLRVRSYVERLPLITDE